MHPSRYRLAYASVLAAAAFAVPAHADEPLRATLSCERAAEPGRVRCSVEAHVDSTHTIAWGDIAILQLPDFATALKGRIGPGDATARDATSTKWAFGLVAKRAGQGEARARVRVMACEASAPSRCAPLTVEVRAIVAVGS
jgi:hypothetical protein